MNDTTSTGPTDTLGRIIERTDAPLPMFLDEKVGRDYGSPSSGWTSIRAHATVMTEDEAKQRLEGPLAMMAPHCRVVTP